MSTSVHDLLTIGSIPWEGRTPTAADLEALLALALSQPDRARAIALAVQAAYPRDHLVNSVARQTIGIVLRDAGESHAAIAELRAALRAARRSHDEDRVGDVLASLGVALAQAGRTGPALGALEESLRRVQGISRARVLVRRAHVLLPLGRTDEALADLRWALTTAKRAGDELWQARCLVHRGWAWMMLGEFARGHADSKAAEVLFARVGQAHEAAWTLNNRAGFCRYEGDLPQALALVERAYEAFAASGPVPINPRIVRAETLLSAGLAPEVLEEVRSHRDHARESPVLQAELMLIGALAALECDDAAECVLLADRARRLFAQHDQGLSSSAALAEIVRLQARAVLGKVSRRDLQQTSATADRLTACRAPEAPLAHLTVARLALERGDEALAIHHLQAALPARRKRPSVSRVTGHLAAALLAGLPDGPSQRSAPRRDATILRACHRGLDAIQEHALGLGDLELRAAATTHFRAVSELALHTALRGTPRALLVWTERVRAAALATPPALPPPDPQLARAMASAREADQRLHDETDPASLVQARRDRARHERAVRERFRQLAGPGGSRARGVDVPDIVAAVGADALVSLCDIRGTLYAVLVHRGRVTRHEVGPSDTAIRESEFARFALRRAAYGRVPEPTALGARLQQALLGPVAGRLPARVTIVPPATLHTAPWGLLPVLADRVVGVAPSARLWLRARDCERTGHIVFVGGPQLSSEQAEVTANRTRYAAGPARVRTLSGPRATAAAVTRALDGAGLAHFAAHGDFRADAPLFSSLRLHDGPLYLYDLQRLSRPPHTVILSACDVGDTQAVGVDEGLGLVTGLLGLGTSAVLASTVPVNDAAAVVVTGHLHDALAGGADLPTAWLAARRHTRADPLAAFTAASFTAWGA